MSKNEEITANDYKKHRIRFIIGFIINISFFSFIFICIYRTFSFSYLDHIYVILCLVLVLYFTVNKQLIRIITCKGIPKENIIDDIKDENMEIELN